MQQCLPADDRQPPPPELIRETQGILTAMEQANVVKRRQWRGGTGTDRTRKHARVDFGSTTNSSANIVTDAVTLVHGNPTDGCTEGTMALESSEVP